jgi:hypothetical protein
MKSMRVFGVFMILTLISLVAGAAGISEADCAGWIQVPSPNIGSSDNTLAAVTAAAVDDIWAVGQYAPDINPNMTLTLIQHFDGSSWRVVSSPNVGDRANALLAASAAAGTVWAVGYYVDPTSLSPRSLIESWNGTSWSIVRHPDPGVMSHLFGVSALASNNVWVVGDTQDSTGIFGVLIEHFDGARWSLVMGANPGVTGNHLNSVSALSANDVWAVGQTFGLDSPDGALIEHFDGTSWSSVASPTEPASVLLYGISAIPGGEVRAVGEAQSDQVNFKAIASQSIDGVWSLDQPINVGRGENHLYGIASGPGGIQWGVGTRLDSATGNLITLVERRDASGWAVEASPNPGLANGNTMLSGVAIIGDTDGWAVGEFDGANAHQSLVLRRCQ